jgi:hypothetical protein
MADIKVLREALAAAVKYPDHHDQGSWIHGPVTEDEDEDDYGELVYGDVEVDVQASNSDHPPCGTAMCIAGWIAFQQAPAGSRLSSRHGQVILPDGTRESIRRYAAALAGLAGLAADALFSPVNTARELGVMIDALEADEDADLYEARGRRT